MHVLITGSSRGIGRETAILMAQKGHLVVATMRTPETCEPFPKELQDHIQLKRLDVSDQGSIESVVNEMKHIDVVVNNAGYGILAPVELCNDEEVFQQFDVNVFGVLRVIRATLPRMREQNSGHIINVSSVAGVVSNPFLGLYAATKHSVEALSAALAANVYPWGIQVSVVEPGPVATEFAELMPLSQGTQRENPYGKATEEYYNFLKERLEEGQPPQEVAQVIVDVAENPNPDFRYQTSPQVHNLISRFVCDPTGNEWLNEQKAP